MFTFADFITRTLPDLPVLATDELLPFSFHYANQPAEEFLPAWQQSYDEKHCDDGRKTHTRRFTDLQTGLTLRCKCTTFPDYPALEWVLYLSNTGTIDTPIISQIRPLDLSLLLPGKSVVVHYAKGSTCAEDDFLPLKNILSGSGKCTIAPYSGRSSQGALPYFNIEWEGGGVAGAIGWSGQWEMNVTLEDQQLQLQAGQQNTHFILHPGEQVRTPRILLINWQGNERISGYNLLRQLQLDYYSPRVAGELPLPPITQNYLVRIRYRQWGYRKKPVNCHANNESSRYRRLLARCRLVRRRLA